MKKAIPIGAHSAKEMKGGTGVPVSGGQKYHRQAFAPSQSYQIPRLGLFSCSQKVGDFDGEKEGGRAPDSDSFDCIGDSTVGGEAFGEVEGHGDNSLQVKFLGKFRQEGNVVSDVLMNGHECNLPPLRHLEHYLPSISPRSARRDESTSDSDPKWSPCLSGSPPVAAMDGSKESSLFLLFPDRLLPWKDPKWSTPSKFVGES